MEKTKEIKVKDNGEKKKLSRDELILQLERELKQLSDTFQYKSGYLAGIREID